MLAGQTKAGLGILQLLHDVVTRADGRQGKLPELVPEAGSLVDHPTSGARVGVGAVTSPETSEDDRRLFLISVAAPVRGQEGGLNVGAGVGVKLAQTVTTTSTRRGAFSLG